MAGWCNAQKNSAEFGIAIRSKARAHLLQHKRILPTVEYICADVKEGSSGLFRDLGQISRANRVNGKGQCRLSLTFS
jgi:hypothetical protein